jgi:cytochrome c2
MSVWRMMAGLGALAMMLASDMARAQNSAVEAGKILYQEHCSTCHGMIASETPRHWLAPSFTRLVCALSCATTPTDVAIGQGMHDRGSILGLWQQDKPPLVTAQRMVVAPPYGPPLRGVYGRPAGSITGFNYSRAFRQRLQGIVWNRETLDTWITDAQAWVPGSLMFYKQPDPEIRHKILIYLETNR